ncbi:MAG: CRISPR system Cascade subunit CasA [Paraglaciecola sp.]|jgi:CRISPR system Cascade subunit CasA
MNLVQDPWLPFRLKDGTEQVLPMSAICDPNVEDFALPRADFQGAAYQFVIGLLQTVFAPDDKYEWHDYYEKSPTAKQLKTAFDKAAHAFNATGVGPLFMQDFDKLDLATSTTVAGLLIGAPGANGLKLNTDHFIKRGVGKVMSLEMAVLALFTLQINAPAGGKGHLVGLRGGGPLTTLILPQKPSSTLWQKIWLNIINRNFWRYEDPDLGDGSIFPWLSPTRTIGAKGLFTFAADVHPLHMYWGMPRRIRLVHTLSDSTCEISGNKSSNVVTQYRTKTYGTDYSGTWDHPLTPYKWDPKKPDEDHLSAKGQPGGITYKTWDALTFNGKESGQQCASVISHYNTLWEGFADMQSEMPRLWVFAYDMDNMKARCWYSSTMPLFTVSAPQQEDALQQIKTLQKLAADTLWHCRTQIKTAWFDRPGDTKGDLSFIDLAFWQRTESAFYTAVAQLIDNCVQETPYLSAQQADTWLKALRRVTSDLFDEYALSELGTQRSMAKKIKARQSLTGWLYGGKDMKRFIREHKINQQEEFV